MDAKNEIGKSRRRWQNLLLLPSRKARTFLMLLSASSLAAASFNIALRANWDSFREPIALSMKPESEAIFTAFDRAMQWSSAAATAFSLVTAVLAFGLSITISLRLYGPLVPIRRLLRQLRDGDYQARGFVRKGDDLQDLMEDLNLLAEKLEKAGKV